MAKDDPLPTKKTADRAPAQATTSGGDVDAFLSKLAATPPKGRPGGGGRLLFALDATASRQPTWDRAARLQGEMFQATSALGGLEVQLAFFRGFGEFKVSKWAKDGAELTRLMTSVMCLAGETQISKVLGHAVNQAKEGKLSALVYVGDCCEEDVDKLGKRAGELGLTGTPAFMFHEGDEPVAAFAFQQIAKLSGGAYCRFDASSAERLKELLSAVAVYAAGGRLALEDFAKRGSSEVKRIAHQMSGG